MVNGFPRVWLPSGGAYLGPWGKSERPSCKIGIFYGVSTRPEVINVGDPVLAWSRKKRE
jgi:hypothetical protein